MADTAMSVNAQGLDVTLSRLFDAPRALVFRAWTDDHMMSQWWGPHGLTATARMDARVGGAYELVMHAPNGEDYPLTGSFLDIVLNERIVMEMHVGGHPANWHDYLAELYTKAGGPPDTKPSLSLITRVTFADEAGGTRLTVTQTYRSAADRDAFVEMGSAGGWGQSFEKLATLLLKA